MRHHVFTLSEAQALQGHVLRVKLTYRDEYDRTLIPLDTSASVIGIDAWEAEGGERLADIAIQFAGHEQDGWLPKVVLVNRTTFLKHFVDTTAQTP